MKYVWMSLLLIGCSSVHKEDDYRFGDVVLITEGAYKDSRAVIRIKVKDEHSSCAGHEYFATILRNGLWTYDYICYNNIGGRL